MTFLAPSLLAIGAAFTAIPILIHFLNRRRHKTVEWAAMKYLLAAMKNNRRRLRFESLLLLIARCACLFVLAFAIARPLGCADSSFASMSGQRIGLHVIVIDDSYSMAYEAGRPDARTHLDQARKLAKQVIGRLESGAQQVAVVTASSPAKILVKPTHDLDAASEAVDRITQSYTQTDLGGALRLASQIADADKTVPTRTLHLFTDSTNSALKLDPQLPQLAQAVATQYRVALYSLGLANQWNQNVASLGASEALVRVGFGSDLVASVGGYGGGETALTWKLAGKQLPGSENLRPDAKGTPITQSQAAFDKPGPVVAEASISSGDRLAIDDVRRQVIDVVGDLKVLIVEGKRGIGSLEGSGAFLKLALAPPIDPAAAANTSARYVTPTEISDLQLAGQPLSEFRSVILAGVGAVSTETAQALKGYVDQGGSVILFMGEPVNGDQYNATLGAAGLLPGTLVARADAGAGTHAFNFDFDPAKPSPVLNAFRNVEKSGLEATQVTTYWRVRPDPARAAEVVLRFTPTTAGEPGDPAITLQRVGRGRVIFVATSADADWSTLVAKPAYVTLVHELLASAVGGGERWMNLNVGQSLELPASIQISATPVLRENEQRSVTLDRVDREGQSLWHSPPVARPGLYTLVAGDKHWPVAVNVPAEEADVRTLGPQDIRHALGDINLELLGDSLPAAEDAAAAQAKSDLSWPILLAVLPLLFLESLMAWKFSRGGGASLPNALAGRAA